LPAEGAHWSLAYDRSGAWWLTGDGVTEREEHGESISGLTGARAAACQPGDGGGAARCRRRLGVERREEGRGEVRWWTVKPAWRSPRFERWPGDDGKAAAVEELSGGGARA
jgi:hypothetical protein